MMFFSPHSFTVKTQDLRFALKRQNNHLASLPDSSCFKTQKELGSEASNHFVTSPNFNIFVFSLCTTAEGPEHLPTFSQPSKKRSSLERPWSSVGQLYDRRIDAEKVRTPGDLFTQAHKRLHMYNMHLNYKAFIEWLLGSKGHCQRTGFLSIRCDSCFQLQYKHVWCIQLFV